MSRSLNMNASMNMSRSDWYVHIHARGKFKNVCQDAPPHFGIDTRGFMPVLHFRRIILAVHAFVELWRLSRACGKIDFEVRYGSMIRQGILCRSLGEHGFSVGLTKNNMALETLCPNFIMRCTQQDLNERRLRVTITLDCLARIGLDLSNGRYPHCHT